MALNPRFNDPDFPLVSLAVLNDNQGKHLAECLDSILDQSYDNIEICFSDNCSTDNSWKIAQAYQQRSPNAIFLSRQRHAFPDSAAYETVWGNVRGHFYVEINAGDAVLHQDFVRTCVDVLKKNPDAGFVVASCCAQDESGRRIDTSPLFDCSCKVPGSALASELMGGAIMTSTAQAMYRKSSIVNKKAVFVGRQASFYFGTHFLNFQLCMDGPVLFLRDELVTQLPYFVADLKSQDALIPVVGPYLLNVFFSDIAEKHGVNELKGRFESSIEEIALRALKLSAQESLDGDARQAKRLVFQAAAMHPDISETMLFRKISAYLTSDARERSDLRSELEELRSSFMPRNSRTLPDGSQLLV